MLHMPFGGLLEALGVHYLGGESLHLVEAAVDIYLRLRPKVKLAREEETVVFVHKDEVGVVLSGQLR